MSLGNRDRSMSSAHLPASLRPSIAGFHFGNSARGVIRSPGLTNLDALVDRTFRIKERTSLEFRTEFFNFSNSAHFGRPNLNIGTPQAGRISTDAFPNRQIQFALRLLF